MLAEIRAELLVLRKRAAVWVLLVAWLVLDLTFAYLLPVSGYLAGQGRPAVGFATPDAYLASALPGQLVPNSLGGMAVFGGALAVVFGVLVTGSDYGWATIKTRTMQRRSRTMLGLTKLVCVAIAALVAVLATFALGAAVSGGTAVAADQAIHWPDAGQVLPGIGAGWLVMTTWALFGAALGFVFRSVVVPIGLGIVWVMGVENLIANVLATQVSWFEPVGKAMPAAGAGALIGAVTRGVDLGEPAPGVNFLVDGARAGMTLALYLLVFGVVSVLTLRRRDIA
jgi:ABC-2 type transport system permease protein